MNNRTTLIVSSIILAVGIIGGTLIVTRSAGSNARTGAAPVTRGSDDAVHMEAGTQVIEVDAKGGYYPNEIVAKAGVATVLRMRTRSTFDCSASFVIPALSVRQMLPPTGVTEFAIPVQKQGSELQAMCGMGMYRLTIAFN